MLIQQNLYLPHFANGYPKFGISDADPSKNDRRICALGASSFIQDLPFSAPVVFFQFLRTSTLKQKVDTLQILEILH